MQRRDFLFLITATAAGARAAPASADADEFWFEYDRAKARARRLGRPVFVYFDAPWCSWCQRYERETLSVPAVRRYLARHYVPALVNYDLRPDLMHSYGGRGLPYTVLLSPSGAVLTRFTGVLTAADLLDTLAAARRHGLEAEPAGTSMADTVYARTVDRDGLRHFRAAFLEHLDGLYSPVHRTLAGRFPTGATLKRPSPLTWLYLHDRGLWRDRLRAAMRIERERLWDPVDGGFFNFLDASRLDDEHVETSKLLETNAWLTALFAEIGRRQPAARKAAVSGWHYLRSRLWDPARGGFWQAQRADAEYYARPAKTRARHAPPAIEPIKRADTNAQAALACLRLASAMHLPEAAEHAVRTVDFLLREFWRGGRLYHAQSPSGFVTPDLPTDGFWVLAAGAAVERLAPQPSRSAILARLAAKAGRWLEQRMAAAASPPLSVELLSVIAWASRCYRDSDPPLPDAALPWALGRLRIEPETAPDEVIIGLAAWETELLRTPGFPIALCRP